MDVRRVGVVLFVLAALVLLAGALSNMTPYTEALKGERDFVSAAWDFDGSFSQQPYMPWDWSFYPSVFNAVGLLFAALGQSVPVIELSGPPSLRRSGRD